MAHSPQRSRRSQAQPLNQGPMRDLQPREGSPSPSLRDRPRAFKARIMPMVPSVTSFAAQQGSQSQQQPSPTISNTSVRRSPPLAQGPMTRPLPTPPHPNSPNFQDLPDRRPSPPSGQQQPLHQSNINSQYARPIARAPAQQFLNKYQNIDESDFQMTPELMAEIELADQQRQAQYQSQPHLYTSGPRNDSPSPATRPPNVERVRAPPDRSSPNYPDNGQQRRQREQQVARESPRAPERQPAIVQAQMQEIPSERRMSPAQHSPLVLEPHSASYLAQCTPDRSLPVQEEVEDDRDAKYVSLQVYPEFQHDHDKPASGIYRAEARSPRPEGPAPPSPHSQTATPSLSPLVSGYVKGKEDPSYSPLQRAGSPYPYPFNYLRRNGQSQRYFDPNNDPAVIAEQVAREWQVFAQNNEHLQSEPTFSPSSTPVPPDMFNHWPHLHTNRMTRGTQDTAHLQSESTYPPSNEASQAIPTRRPDRSLPVQAEAEDEITSKTGADARQPWQNTDHADGAALKNTALGLGPLPLVPQDTAESQAAVFAAGQQSISGSNFWAAANIHLNQSIINRAVTPSPPGNFVVRPSRLTRQAFRSAEEVFSSHAESVPPSVIDPSIGNPGAFTDNPGDSTAASGSSCWGASTALSTNPRGSSIAAFTDRRYSCWGAPHVERSLSYSDKPITDDSDPAEQAPPCFVDAVRNHADIAGPPVPVTLPSHVEQAYGPDMEHDEGAECYQGGFEQADLPFIQEQQEIAAPEPHHEPEHSYSLPSYLDHKGRAGIPAVNDRKAWNDIMLGPMPPSSHSRAHSSHMSRTPSIRSGHTSDPFADPAPEITYSHSDVLYMPQPKVASQHPQTPEEEDHGSAYGPLTTSLPAQGDVTHPQNFDQRPSQSTYCSARDPFETDETLHLLAHPVFEDSYFPWTQTHGFISPAPPSTPSSSRQPRFTHTPNQPRLHDLGWLEYHLPDGTTYYVHPTRRITTDCHLRSDRILAVVSACLEDNKCDSSRHAGSEMWLRDVGTPKQGFVPARSWVDHHARVVVTDLTGYRIGQGKVIEEDQLDMEYRYWSYIEAHPAHNPLPPKAKALALGVLNWAWTDRIIPSPHAVPTLFTQDECQELMTLVRSFGHEESQNDSGFQSRIVSKILLRLAQWRQLHHRPNKPLPEDATTRAPNLPTHRCTIQQAVFHFITSFICPRIPYTFLEHVRNSRLGEVSGLRNASPMIVVGACTFLVAAVVPSTSVRFLSITAPRGLRALWPSSLLYFQWLRRLLLSSGIRAIGNGQYRM